MATRKRKPMSILIAVGLAITMIFAVVALAACNNGGGEIGNPIYCICEDECYGECNFSLTIEVDSFVLEATYNPWLEMYVVQSPPIIKATLTNISGKTATIARRDFTRAAVTFDLSIPTGMGWIDDNVPAPPSGGWSWVSLDLSDEEYISTAPRVLNTDFPVGEHDATIIVSFYINHRGNNRQLINIKYNFTFTVINSVN